MDRIKMAIMILLTLTVSVMASEKSKIPGWLQTGEGNSRMEVFGGINNHLYGYYDERYVDDKYDYIKADAMQIGIEYYQSKKISLNPYLDKLRFGTNINFYKHDRLNQKNLDAVERLSIAEKTVPEKESDRVSRFHLNLGFFIGYDRKWFGFDFGLTYALKAYYENTRVRNTQAGTEEVSGRGWTWNPDGASLLPNVYLRLGREKSAHFTLEYLRGDYSPEYGDLQLKVTLPVNQYFALKVGGYTSGTDAAFIQPVFKFKGIELATKMGTIINYQDDHLERVGIQDSLFGNISLSYNW